ncbi:MAG: ROK family protein, partial [Planctomycetes bacterium]|nr:ROK family protein [Planctomycetota bacterium]
IDAARSGDATAIAVVDEAARRLGQGLAIIADILAPDRIVIGGIFARSRDVLWPAAERVFADETLSPIHSRCRVVPAELGEAIGDYAAIAAALGETPAPTALVGAAS